MACEIRQLVAADVPELRRLQAVAPEKHMQYVLRRFPRYYEAISILESPQEYIGRQVRILGAFNSETLIGTVGLLRVPDEQPQTAASESTMEKFCEVFSEHDADVFDTVVNELLATYIGAPVGSLLINSLCVMRRHRRQGVARMLLDAIVDSVENDFIPPIYIEVSRGLPIQKMLSTLQFRVVKKTFSFSEWFQFSTWGSVLMMREQ